MLGLRLSFLYSEQKQPFKKPVQIPALLPLSMLSSGRDLITLAVLYVYMLQKTSAVRIA